MAIYAFFIAGVCSVPTGLNASKKIVATAVSHVCDESNIFNFQCQ